MTDAELTRAVAERLGWWNIGTYEITSRGVTYRGNPPMMDGDARQRLPDFATDLNAAWGLLAELQTATDTDDERWVVYPTLGGQAFAGRMRGTDTISTMRDEGVHMFREHPARAICELYLAATEGR